MRQIHQILPFLAYEDAIGNHVLEIRRWLRQWGYRSEIFVEGCDTPLTKECHPYEEYKNFSSAENLLILHYSVGGSVNRYVRQVPDQVVIYYHNITPAHFFYQSNGHLARQLAEARRDLKVLAGKVPAIADSPYNALELKELGFKILGIVPPVLALGRLNVGPSKSISIQVTPRFTKPEGYHDWLFVGRIVPNKCIQDIIKSFYYYHTWIDSQSRLLLVGGTEIAQTYFDEIQHLVKQLNFSQSVIFTGHVTDQELVSIYHTTDLYVSMSEHEGFGVPIVEAMYCGIPVLAYASTSVPDTMGNAGILIQKKNYSVIAELAYEMICNPGFRARLVQTGKERVKNFSQTLLSAQFLSCLEKLG